MTKHVRIENADAAPTPVRITFQSKATDGSWKDEDHYQIDYEGAMYTATLTPVRRVVIEELGPAA